MTSDKPVEFQRGQEVEWLKEGEWLLAMFVAYDLVGHEPIIQQAGSMPIFATTGSVRPIAPTGDVLYIYRFRDGQNHRIFKEKLEPIDVKSDWIKYVRER